jgi:hypothetical protein
VGWSPSVVSSAVRNNRLVVAFFERREVAGLHGLRRHRRRIALPDADLARPVARMLEPVEAERGRAHVDDGGRRSARLHRLASWSEVN